MDLGLYQMKHPFARLINGLLVPCRRVDPNVLSLSIIPLGLIIAGDYLLAPGHPALYLLGIALIFVRLIVATLDGMVAVKYDKGTPAGEVINRVAPELADLMLMGALVSSRPDYAPLAVPVLLVAWGTSFFGLIGLVAKRPIQSVGPVGQTDRLAALMLCSLLQAIGGAAGWSADFIGLFLVWTIAGGTLTMVLRCYRTAKAVTTR